MPLKKVKPQDPTQTEITMDGTSYVVNGDDGCFHVDENVADLMVTNGLGTLEGDSDVQDSINKT